MISITIDVTLIDGAELHCVGEFHTCEQARDWADEFIALNEAHIVTATVMFA